MANEEETLKWLFHGEVNRTTAEHLLNKESNRSHCIFTIYISQRARMGSSAARVRRRCHRVRVRVRVCRRV